MALLIPPSRPLPGPWMVPLYRQMYLGSRTLDILNKYNIMLNGDKFTGSTFIHITTQYLISSLVRMDSVSNYPCS